MIYLDHASTSPPDPEVIEEVARAMAQFFGNPASAHRLGYEAEKAGQGSLMTLGRLLGADPERLVVTSGGTESTNLALKGFFEANPRSPRRIVTSALEHASTHEVCNALAARGIDVVRVGSDRNGAPSLEELDGALSRGPGLISLIHVNNETGAVLDMAELVRIRDRRCPGTPIHLDFVQGAFKMPLDLGRSRIQMVSTSAHKFHGPRGIGLLALARDVRLAPEILGGGQQGGLRSGTLDIPSLLGMAKAAVRMQSLVRDGIDGTRAFRDRFLAAHPGIEMDFHLSHDLLTPLLREDLDLAIDCVEHPLAELERTPLFREAYMVACAPDYRAAQAIAQPADLARCTVLSIDKACGWWDRFLAAFPKSRQPAFGRVIEINHIRGMITAAVNGFGVLIAPSYSLQGELQRGALVPLFPSIRPLEDRFALYQKTTKARLAKHRLLKDYLVQLNPAEFGA